MRVLDDHSARDFGDVAKPPDAVLFLHRHNIAGLQQLGRGLAAALYLRGISREQRGLAISEANGRIVPAFRHDDRDAPVLIAGAEVLHREVARPVLGDRNILDGPVPALAGIVAHQPVAQRRRRQLLQSRVERGPDPQAARINAIFAVVGVLAIFGDQRAAHVLDEIASHHLATAAAHGHGVERLRPRLGKLRFGDEAVALHLTQHPVAPLDRAALEALGAIVGRRLGQDRKISRLVQLELVHILVEIGARRRLHAIGVAAEEYLVEVELQDLLLGERVLDTVGEDRLADLAGIGDLVGQQQVLRDLLGDGGRAARRLLPDHALDRGADQSGIVEPAMAEEGAVLGREERIHQHRRIFVEAKLDAPLAREAVDRRAVERADVGRQRRLIGLELLHRREVPRKNEQDQQPSRDREDDERGDRLEPPGLADVAAPCPKIGRAGAEAVDETRATRGVGHQACCLADSVAHATR